MAESLMDEPEERLPEYIDFEREGTHNVVLDNFGSRSELIERALNGEIDFAREFRRMLWQENFCDSPYDSNHFGIIFPATLGIGGTLIRTSAPYAPIELSRRDFLKRALAYATGRVSKDPGFLSLGITNFQPQNGLESAKYVQKRINKIIPIQE